MAREITCILTTSREHHEHITRVGGSWGGNISREDCASDIRTGRETYFTMGGGMRAQVEAFQSRGIWFIRTVADATRKDNLLSLPDCR